MIKRLFGKSSSITSAAIVIAAAGLLSRFLGVIRDRVLASRFGAGDSLDIYYAAFQLPDIVFNLLVLGALSAGFIPVFVQLLKDEDKLNFKANEVAWKLVNTVLTIFGIALILLGLVLAFCSQWILPLTIPGFSEEKLEQVIALARIIFLSPFLLGLSAVFGGVLQSYKRFFLFSLSPIMYNAGIIFGALFLTKFFGLYGLAFGVIIGAFMHMIIQVPTVIRFGWRYRPSFDFRNVGFLKILKMTGPRVLALASNQINLIIVTFLASFLPLGSLAIFNLANNLQSFPIGLFGISFAVAAFPALSKAFAKNDETEFNQIFLRTLKQIMFLIIPFSLLLVILRIQLVRVVLGSGAFDWDATKMTASAVGVFCLSLFAQALTPFINRVYFSRQDTMTAFWVSLLSVGINFVVSFYLIQYYGVLGLVFGFSISAIVNFILLIVILRFKAKEISFAGLVDSLLRVSLASLAMAVVAQNVKTILGLVVNMDTFLGVLTQGVVAGLLGVITFAVAAYILKIEEFNFFVEGFKKKVLRRVNVKEVGMQEIN
jgi:putative peptidoglycan lipid II flippase